MCRVSRPGCRVYYCIDTTLSCIDTVSIDTGIDTGPILKRHFIDTSLWAFDDIEANLEQFIPSFLFEAVERICDFGISCEEQEVKDGNQYFVPDKKLISEARQRFNEKK